MFIWWSVVVGEPQGHLGDARGPLVDLDAVELVDVDSDGLEDVEVHLLGAGDVAQHRQLQAAQLAIGDHEEVAASARRVEKAQLPQALLELEELVHVALYALEFSPEIVEEQRPDQPQDVGLGGVVRAGGAPVLGVHDALEQAAEHRRRNAAPVQRAALQERLAHLAVEVGDRQHLGEQLAVDVGELLQLLVEGLLALHLRRVEHLEQARQVHAQIGAVGGGAVLEVLGEEVAPEQARVLGEHAEQQAHQQHLEGVAVVAGAAELIMQQAQVPGGLDVDGVLRAEGAGLVAGHEAEQAHVEVKLVQRKLAAFVGLEVVQAKAREVGDEHVVRKIAVLEAGEVVHRLVKGAVQIAAAGFVFDQQHALPQQVDEPVAPVALDHGLLEAGQPPTRHAEHVEELIPEGLGLGVLGGLVLPLLGEGQGAVLDFVPAQWHASRTPGG